MTDKVIVDEVQVHADARGYVFEPVGEHDLEAQRNCHIVVSEPGAIRGNHYHKTGSEIIIVRGPALVRYKEQDQIRDVHVPDGAVYRFRIPPGISHAIRNTGSTPNVLAAFNTIVHDRDHPDTVSEDLIS